MFRHNSGLKFIYCINMYIPKCWKKFILQATLIHAPIFSVFLIHNLFFLYFNSHTSALR